MTTQINPATQVANGTLPAGVVATNATNAVSLNGIGTAANFNADFASIVGSPSYPFNVANATTASQAVALGQFSFTGPNVNNSQTFPNTYSIKSGSTLSIGANTVAQVVFTTAFPITILSIVVTPIANGNAPQAQDGISAVSASGFTVSNSDNIAHNIYWLAIGY